MMTVGSSGPTPVFTVSSLTSRIRQVVAGQFRDILVEGEISNQKLYPSGHLYFTLKDSSAVIRAVMFNFSATRLPDTIEDGIAVICRGRVDVYEKRGDYQLIVDTIHVKGLGLLQLKFEALKNKLLKEGLFSKEHKRPLPFLPRRIGIVTSPAGAAIRDMLTIISRKSDAVAVILYPVKVQGNEACYEIVEGIEYFNRTGEVDIIITGRGGGSLEDLAPFNEEMVARAIFRSKIPVVTGIGHEIDYTIADFVADVRAPTPTAAADSAIRDKEDVASFIKEQKQRIHKAMTSIIEQYRLRMMTTTVALRERKDLFTTSRIYLDDLHGGLIHGTTLFLAEHRHRLNNLIQRLNDLNPEGILKRGYSITMRKDTGEILIDPHGTKTGEHLVIKLHKGNLDVTVTGKKGPEH